MATGVVFTEEFKQHDTGDGHPESKARVDAVGRALSHPDLSGKLVSLKPRRAEREEILLVHWDRLYEEVTETEGREKTYLDADTVASSSSSSTAHLAAGSVLTAVEAVMEGQVQNAFAFSRPPGHHAKPDKAMGFCFFNNVAVAVQYAQKRYGLERVLIIDFDVHHGNGTQKAFYTSPQVVFVSTHQSPHYPGTGAVEEVGKDDGRGYTVNIPMPAGLGDEEYLHVFRELVIPVGREFSPELVLVSAGFDAHRDDPLGGMEVTRRGFATMTDEILRLARSTCEGKAIFALEGGYNLAALEKSIVSVLTVMTGARPEAIEPRGADEAIGGVRAVHKEFWSSLR